MDTNEREQFEIEKSKLELTKIKAETERLLSDQRKLDSENEKAQEELRQSKVPYWRRPSYLSIFLPVLASLTIGYWNFNKTRKSEQALEIQSLTQEREKLQNEKLGLERVQLNQAKDDAIAKKEAAENEKNKIVEEREVLTKKNNQLISKSNSIQEKLKDAEGTLKKLNEDNFQSIYRIDSLKGVLRLTSKDNLDLLATISSNKLVLDSINKDINNINARAQMITLLTINLKSLLIKFYTNWNKNVVKDENNRLYEELQKVTNDLENHFKTMHNNAKYTNEFNDLMESIKDFLDDPSAFRKVKFLDNIKYVKDIDSDTDKLIKALQSIK